MQSHALVIATGASANYLGLPSEEKYKNHGVSACAVCDGALPRFRNKPLVVVGGGDSAAEEANYLTKFASERLSGASPRRPAASQIMAERLLSNPKVKPVWNSVVDEVLGDEERGVTAVRVKNVKTNETRTIDATGMFVAIGHTPNTKFLNGQLEVDEKGFIVLKDRYRTHHQRGRRFRRRRRGRPDLQTGDHRRRHGLQGGTGCRALAGGKRRALIFKCNHTGQTPGLKWRSYGHRAESCRSD